MEQRFAIVLVIAGLLSAPLSASTYYVAPSGSDTATGSLAAPFKTLAKGMATAQAGDTLTLRQGVYRETLTAVRGGTSAAPIVVRGAAGESAVLAGSDLVSGAWTLNGGRIWRIDGLPATWSLYVDGVELNEARWPNAALGARMDVGYATADTGTNSTTLVDAALPATNLDGAKVRIAGGSAWVSYSRTIQAYGGGQFSFDSSAGGNASYYPKPGNVYVLYRHLALLDAAGEWYQDPATLRLYVWMPAGDSPSAHQVEIARRKQLAVINAFSYVQLRDLFSFSGAINFTNSSGSKVVNVHQKYVHTNIDVDGYNYPPTPNQFSGGSGCEWSGGSIEGSWGDGIFISGSNHHIFDMEIHDICRVGTYRGAVRMNGTNHIVEHNDFYDSGRFLIYHGGSKGGALRYNHLYNAGLLTKDLGATYCFQTNGGGMEIAYNHIHDVHCEVGAGIYLDNASADFRVHHNLVHDVDWFALKLNLPSYDNIVVNNTLFATKYWVNAAGAQFAQEMTGTALVNNLYGGGGTARLITGSMGPSLITNATYTAPPAIFNTGAWTLATGSPAIDKGTVYAPWTNGYCGAKPDQGCFESACSTAWTAGNPSTPPVFPYPFPSTGSPTPTPTRTPILASPSATPLATRTQSPTATRTSSASATPTASPSATATRSPSPTATATPSPTRTASATPTPSATRTASSSPSPSMTPSGTPTASRTGTATATGSGTPTASSTASASPSATPSGTASTTATLSATLTTSFTGSPTASPTPSATASATASTTRTTSPTATASGTQTSTPSGSATPSSTASPSPSPSRTATMSPTASPSATPSSSPTPSSNPTTSAGATALPSASATPTATPSASPASTPTATESPSSLPTPSETAVSTPLPPTPLPDGPLLIHQAVAFPQPNPQSIRVQLGGPAERCELRLFSPAYVCLGILQSASAPAAGWVSVPIDGISLPNGSYFYELRAQRGIVQSPVVRGRFVVLH